MKAKSGRNGRARREEVPTFRRITPPTREEQLEMTTEFEAVLQRMRGITTELGKTDLAANTVEQDRLWQELEHCQDIRLRIANQVVARNERFLFLMVRRYARVNLDLDDALQVARLGLLKGLTRFDHGHGVTLLTYASWWIRQSITRTVYNESRMIRIPVGIWDKGRQAQRALRKDPNHELSKSELAAHQAIRDLRPASLNRPIDAEHETCTLEDVIPDTRYMPDKPVSVNEDGARIRAALNKLTTREATVISLRFGLKRMEHDDEMDEQHLDEIGQRYGLSRERIRQIESAALKKLHKILRHPDGITRA